MIRFLRIYLPISMILLALCYSFYHLTSGELIYHAELEDTSLSKLEQQLLHDDFQGFVSDLIIFANMQEWRFAFDGANKTSLQEVAEEFKTLLATKGGYEKIRLLTLQGKELLRVEFHQGRVESIPTDKLQNKSHRYYLAASKTLLKNQIYVSPLDLNWENGKPERPLEPVIRLITPIYDAHGEKQGLLVLNILAESMLQRLMDKHADAPKRSLLINRQGDWLHDGELTNVRVFLLPDQPIQQFRDKFPEAWQQIHQHEHGQFTNKAGLFTYATIRPLQAAHHALPENLRRDTFTDKDNTQQQVWKIIQFRSSSELAALTTPIAQRIGAYTALFLLLLIPLIWRMISSAVQREQSEAALRLSRQRHELYVSQTRLAVIEWGADFTVVSWNHGAEDIFGYRAEQATGKHASELLLSEDQCRVVDVIWHQLLATKGGVHSINENVTSDGRIITCEWHNTPLIRKNGEVVGVTSLCRDISKEQRQQVELNKLRQAIEHAGESFMITDVDAKIEYVNPAFSKITGFAAGEVIGQTPEVLNSGRQDDAFYQHLWQKITSGETWHGSLIDKRKDGSLYPALMSIAPIIDKNGIISHFVAIQQDMSEHEELEEKFRQAQKMEALGTLVGGIAHDFNNVLAGMLGNLYLVRKKTIIDADVQEKLVRVEQAGHRAAEMIQQLLTFSRKGKSELKPMAVRSFIKEILKLARSSIPENIVLLHDLGEHDYRIRGDGSQMQQMILNLLVNASHALEGIEKPAITISMCIYEPDDDFLFVHRELEAKILLCITVADNGCGISKANQERVFEPFFTTKEEGKGTGLGLAMVYGSMQNHGGVIEIESAIGEGSRMNLYFPLCDSDAATDTKEQLNETVGMGETILLADDNVHVRETMQEVLQELGYRVLAAEDGQQALLMFIDHASEIDLALLDIVMPVMGGAEAAERLRELQPDLPILFLSGYDKKSVSPLNKPGMQDIEVLSKPIDLAELSHHIRKNLNP